MVRGRLGALNELYPLPTEILDGRVKDGFTYPVAVYDHDEGAWRSPPASRITAGSPRCAASMSLATFIGGRIFASDLAAMKKADDGIPRTVAPIEEVQLYERDAGGNRVNVSLQELIDRKMGSKIARADLFISQTRDGELLITSRQDGTIRMLVPDSRGEN